MLDSVYGVDAELLSDVGAYAFIVWDPQFSG